MLQFFTPPTTCIPQTLSNIALEGLTTRLLSNLFSPPDGNRRQFRIRLHVSNEEKKICQFNGFSIFYYCNFKFSIITVEPVNEQSALNGALASCMLTLKC